MIKKKIKNNKNLSRKLQKIILILANIILLSLFAISCVKNNNQIRDPRIIDTYDSPSQYYGRPLSKSYSNPYAIIESQRYIDNDFYYRSPIQRQYIENYYNPNNYRQSQKTRNRNYIRRP